MSDLDPRIRSISIKVELIRWNWSVSAVDRRDSEPIDLTADGSVLNYRYQKSIKTPRSTAQLTILPQRTDVNILDIISTMDVIRIYEFGILKFQGYVRRVNYSGSINPRTGAPTREGVITAAGFGGLLEEALVGLGLGRVVGNQDAFINSAVKLKKAVSDAALEATSTYSAVLNVLTDEWFTFIESIGGSAFRDYVFTYMDFSSALATTTTQLLPRTFDMYTGMEESMSFWSVAQRLAEMPLNELWLDNGPRDVRIAGVPSQLREDKTYMVFRPTPFDNFSSIPAVTVPKQYLTRFDLSKSMDEVFSVYAIQPSAFQLNEIVRVMLGEVAVDKEAVNKYLYRLLTNQLFYARLESENSTAADSQTATISSRSQEAADKLKSWFENNDEYYSGAITMMVPARKDVRIGDKVTMEGLTGSFYVEGVAHTWAYQGTLSATLSVTRGWDYLSQKPLRFKDRIFKGGIIP